MGDGGGATDWCDLDSSTVIHYFYGEDTYAAREAVAAVAEEQRARLHWLEKEDLENKPPQAWFQETHGLFGAEVLVVRDVSQLTVALKEKLVEALKEPVKAEVVLWDRGTVDKRSKLWRVMGGGKAREFKRRSDFELVAWLQDRAKKKAGMIDEAAASDLARRAGGDRWRMVSELDRLLLVTNKIDLALVQKEVKGELVEDVFRVINAVAKKERERAVRGVEVLLAEGNSELYVLTMLAYQFKTLWVIAAGNVKKIHPFAVAKNAELAKQFSAGQLVDILTRILACDLAIKQGKMTPRTGLMMLVLGLT